MANNRVYTGADGALTLAASQGNDGASAPAVIEGFDMIAVARLQNVRVEVQSEIRAFHEIGQRYATELRPGNITVRGTIGRAMVNGAMLRMMLGGAADGRPAGTFNQPLFNISLVLENAAEPGVRNTLTLHDVRLESWVYGMPEDDFVAESVGFQALYATVADEA
jgi:hypothetical protein